MNLLKTYLAILLFATVFINASKKKEKQWKRVPAKEKTFFGHHEICDGCHQEQKKPAFVFHNQKERKLCYTCYHSSLNPGIYLVIQENFDEASISTLKTGDAVNVLEVRHREGSIMGRIEGGWVLIKKANTWFLLPTTADYVPVLDRIAITQYPSILLNSQNVWDVYRIGDYVKILEIVEIPEESLIRGRTERGWVSILDTERKHWYMQPVSDNIENRELTIEIADDDWGVTINYTKIPFEISQVSSGKKFHQLQIKEGWKILKFNDIPVSKANAVESEKRLKRKGRCSITFLTSIKILPENVEFEQTAESAEQTEYPTPNNANNESMLGDHDECITKESTKTGKKTTERKVISSSKSGETFPTWAISFIITVIILCFVITGLCYLSRQKQVVHDTMNHPKTTQIVPETLDDSHDDFHDDALVIHV